jgi:L-threonylcarbamoyladenylate synthase
MGNSQFFSNCTADNIRDAAAALKAGHLVAFPTETVYGLGADARNPEAIKRIYQVKARPTDHPLIVHISSINQLEKWASEVPDYAVSLARAFWPGPLTLILKRSDLIEDFITGGQNTVGLRVPKNPIALALIEEFEKITDSAIAAPSANRFGQVSPTSSADVEEELRDYLSDNDLVLDGGRSEIGIESTIVDCSMGDPVILRAGFVTKLDIQQQENISVVREYISTEVKFSGSFEKHYAPKCSISTEEAFIPGAGLLACIEVETPEGMVRLASPASVHEFARELYSAFRAADKAGLLHLVVLPPKGEGLAVAINERIKKASLGR